jgi:sugar fermentation stimulation protein A
MALNMKFPKLVKATLVKRYKRFLADVILESGVAITVYCPNTGAMTGCAEPGSNVWLSISDNQKRKYKHTWELVKTARDEMVCIHSAKANQLVREAIELGVIEGLAGYDNIRSEVKYGEENSRIDFLLERDSGQCFIEVKSVTMLTDKDCQGVFPDAISDRGRKHLRELIAVKKLGHRAVLFFCVLHTGINSVTPADLIDQKYGETFREALAVGVEVFAYRASISPEKIELLCPVQVYDRQQFS